RGSRAGAEVVLDELCDGRFEEQLGRIDTRSEILWLLAQLSRQQRAVLVLRYFDDMSEAEVAHNLSIPIGTVKSTTSRALDRLRRSLSYASTEPPRTHLPLAKGTL